MQQHDAFEQMCNAVAIMAKHVQDKQAEAVITEARMLYAEEKRRRQFCNKVLGHMTNEVTWRCGLPVDHAGECRPVAAKDKG